MKGGKKNTPKGTHFQYVTTNNKPINSLYGDDEGDLIK